MRVGVICVTSWQKHSGLGEDAPAEQSHPLLQQPGRHELKAALFLSHDQEGSPGKLPNQLWHLHEGHINHNCAKSPHFWVGLLLAHPD